MLTLLSYVKKDPKEEKEGKGWVLKILCALHCTSSYLAIKILQPNSFSYGGNGCIKKEFEGKERHFVDPFRFMFYKICKDLKFVQANKVMQNIGQSQGWKRMETAFLLQIKEKGSHQALVNALKEESDPDVSRIRDKADCHSLALLRQLNQSPNDLILEKGRCLIIAQDKYKSNSGFDRRQGTDNDVIYLAQTWREFGCQNPLIRRDIKNADGFRSVIREFQESLKGADFDYVVVCILSHGRKNSKGQEEILGINGKGITTEELKNMLIDANQCPQLLMKPKIFLIQACRGNVENTLDIPKSMTSRCSSQDLELECDSLMDDYKAVPRSSHYYVAYSTPPGYVAYRNPVTGSPFIQAFCKALNDFGHQCYSLTKLMQLTTNDMQNQCYPQTPEVNFNMPGELYFVRSSKNI